MLEIKTFEVGGLGTNTYVVSDKKNAIIIDAAEEYSPCIEYIKSNNLTVKYLILTHGHGDHIGGVKGYKEKFAEMKVIAGEEEKEILGIPKHNYTRDIFKKDLIIEPEIYVKDGDEIDFNENVKMKFIHTPGHTKGGISILIENNLFVGDTLFFESCGRADLYSGDWETLVKSVREKIYVLDPSIIVYPGHGPKTDIDHEMKANPYIRPDFDWSGE